MREILYRKRQSVKNRQKRMSIRETSEEQDCKTTVRKHFVYLVTKEQNVEQNITPPRIDILKCLNTQKKEEKFNFRVKGYFYISREGNLFKVRFCHSLNICISWKSDKQFSPKKSVTLT